MFGIGFQGGQAARHSAMKASNVAQLGVMRRCPLILDVECWAEASHLVDEEVRRADHSTRLALMPVGEHRLHRIQAGAEADGSSEAGCLAP